MDAFETGLKRAFAETHDPVDDGFSVRVGTAVRRREAGRWMRQAAEIGGFAAGMTAIAAGLVSVAGAFVPGIWDTALFEVAKAQTLVSSAPAFNINSLGMGLTQILLAAATLAGSAAVVRNSQQQ